MVADRSEVLAAVMGASHGAIIKTVYPRGGYRQWSLSSGWVVGFDPSLSKDGALPEESVEINTPPFECVDQVAPVIRAVSRTAHQLTPRCGLHIHVDAVGMTPERLLLVCRRVDLLRLSVRSERRYFCKPLPSELLALPLRCTEEDLKRCWFAGYKQGIPEPGKGRLHPARRRLLNMGSVWYRGTLEFRWFDATLEVDQIAEHLRLVQEIVGRE